MKTAVSQLNPLTATTAIWRFAVITQSAVRLTPSDTYVSLCISIPSAPVLKQSYTPRTNRGRLLG